jgi:hypothetical protein
VNTPLFADGPNPALMAIPGSMVCSGVFMALAAVSGGLWYARRSKGLSHAGPRRLFFVAVGGAVVFAALATWMALALYHDQRDRDAAIVGKWQEVDGGRVVEFHPDRTATVTAGDRTDSNYTWYHYNSGPFRLHAGSGSGVNLEPKAGEMVIPLGDEKPRFRKVQ